ncbi:MAG: hypothetical protein AB1568_00750 [Thermodesulfobacteriota bacterium]
MNQHCQPIDILGEILTGAGTLAPDQRLEELTVFCLERQAPPSAIGIIRKKRRAVLNRKTTHYLEQEVFTALEGLRDCLRDIQGPTDGRRRPVSKSAIVNAVLGLLLDEFRAHGRGASLVGQLLRKL